MRKALGWLLLSEYEVSVLYDILRRSKPTSEDRRQAERHPYITLEWWMVEKVSRDTIQPLINALIKGTAPSPVQKPQKVYLAPPPRVGA